MRSLPLSILMAATLSAQVPVGGPVEGILFDPPTKSFRAVNGSLGTASLGESLANGYEFGSVAPRARHGLAFVEDRLTVVSNLGVGDVVTSDLAGGPFTLPEGAAWSANGRSAVLYSKSARWIRVVTGLPDAPEAGPAIDLALVAVAVDAEGSRIAVATSGDGAGIHELSGGLSLTPLAEGISAAALAFDADGRVLYALDAASPRLLAIRGHEAAEELAIFEEIADASALAYDRNGRREFLYAAYGTEPILIAYDLQTREVAARVELAGRAQAIVPIGAGGFLLGGRTGEHTPLWSFTRGSHPRVLFVPAGPVSSSEETGK